MILPGKTIGILGGGQLGRMFAIAARRMGYRVHAFDPTQDCPTGQIADVEVNAAYDDVEAAKRFAREADVVTFEFENVPAQTLATIEKLRPVHPSPFVLDTCRHRLREKDFLSKHGFPVTQYRAIHSATDLATILREGPIRSGILKGADYGYDGKGQVGVSDADASPPAAEAAWKKMGRPLGVLEALVPFDRELSVIVARTSTGETRCFTPVINHHVNGILDTTTAPADLPEHVAREASQIAVGIADALNLVGLLAVEMFLFGKKLLVNELAPRPHNSGHVSIDACVTSQFEQQLRAVCGLPLGDPSLMRPAAMANLLGDLWQSGEPNWAAGLASSPEVKLHLYGKRTPQPGRKMGHLTATAESPEAAKRIVLAAREALLSRR
jgi:5-(carboxyamino)imidazole ribonucleotide synthase